MLRFQSPPSSFFEKSQSANPFPGSPAGPIWRELPVSRTFFYMSLGFLNKSSLDRTISPFSQSPWERSVPSMIPKMGQQWKQTPVSRSLPNTHPSGSPVREPSLQVPLKELTQRYYISRYLIRLSLKVPDQ